MGIVLSHVTALEVLRRWDAPRLIERGRLERPARLPDRMPSPAQLACALERVPCLADVSLPLHVLVGTERGRHRSDLLRAHLTSAQLPPAALFRLAPDVLCAGAELVALQMSEFATDIELLLLVDELCGHYGIQPLARSGLVSRPDPLTSVSRIGGLLDALGDVRGASKLRRALARARERSGSPQESRTVHRLEFSVRCGGFGLEVVGLNDPVLVGRADALLSGVSERVRRPDILLLAPEQASGEMPFAGVAIDYQGAYHRDPLQEGRDINRRNELLAAGIKDYEVAREHAADLTYMNWLVSCVRRDLGLAEPRPPRAVGEARAARRARLAEKLDAADGLRWTGRDLPLVMAEA